MTPAPDEVPGVTPPPPITFPTTGAAPEITNEPDDVQEQSPEISDDPGNPNADSIVYKDTTPVDAGRKKA